MKDAKLVFFDINNTRIRKVQSSISRVFHLINPHIGEQISQSNYLHINRDWFYYYVNL